MKFLLLAISLITFGVLSFYILNLSDYRFSFSEMDLDQSGFISFTEADYVSSSGERIITVKGQSCIEYFAFKDGSTIKTKCG